MQDNSYYCQQLKKFKFTSLQLGCTFFLYYKYYMTTSLAFLHTAFIFQHVQSIFLEYVKFESIIKSANLKGSQTLINTITKLYNFWQISQNIRGVSRMKNGCYNIGYIKRLVYKTYTMMLSPIHLFKTKK